MGNGHTATVPAQQQPDDVEALEYLPQLDGLRAVAVYLVLAFHSGLAWASGGFIGVDLFFVLSGFLVTMVILHEVDRTGSFSVTGFYARRVRRLLPAAVVVIVAICLAQLLVAPLRERLGMVDDARAALLYVANWQFIVDARAYFATGPGRSPFLHFWSLSIEEQFYVGYPVLLLLLIKVRRLGALAAVLALALATSLVLQVTAASDDLDYAYYATHTRIYQLLAGALLALAVRRFTPVRSLRSWLGDAVAAAALLALVVLATSLAPLSQSMRGVACTLAAVAAIGGLVTAGRGRTSGLLARPLPRHLGQISYSTYLWHWPVILLVNRFLAVGPWTVIVIAGTVATALAALSFQVLETPVRRAPRLNRLRVPVVSGGLALSVLAAVVVVPTMLEDPRRPAVRVPAVASSSQPGDVPSFEGMDEPVPGDLDITALLEDDGEIGPQCSEGTPESCSVVADNDGPLVAVVGDSHAAMLAPALHRLAEERDFRLSTDIMNNCPWFRGLTVDKAPSDLRARCVSMREVFYDRILPAMDPDVVLLVSRVLTDAHWASKVTAADAADHPDETHREMLRRLTDRTVADIRSTGARVVIVHTIFGRGGYTPAGSPPLDCLRAAEKVADCAFQPPAARPSIDGYYQELGRELPGVSVVDLDRVFCPNPEVCAPIEDGIVTWKDINHLSSDYTVAVRDRMWKAVTSTPAWRRAAASS